MPRVNRKGVVHGYEELQRQVRGLRGVPSGQRDWMQTRVGHWQVTGSRTDPFSQMDWMQMARGEAVGIEVGKGGQ